LSAETISTSAPLARACVAVLLDRRQAEGGNRRAHQRELRHEIGRRVGAMRLVERIELAAERILRLVEDDRQMRRLDPRRAVAQELQHLGREQPDRADRQLVGAVVVFRILADRLEIGAENERRAVDQKNMVAGADRTVGGRRICHALICSSPPRFG
jgi:hypothetical protein